MCISKQITGNMFGDIQHVPALYMFEQRGSNLYKTRATCQQIPANVSVRELAFREQLVGH